MKNVAQPKKVTVAVLSYIPFLSGFYAECLDVLKLCLNSLWENTTLPYDLLVFDNGSGSETQDYLRQCFDEGRIQYLVLSQKNMGKGGAWNVILSGAPGEIIAYADSDVLFLPGWLETSLELLEGYPKVGMVTSRPFRTNSEFLTSTVAWAENEQGVKVEKGQFIPWETFLEFNLSLGAAEDEIRKTYETTQDTLITYRDLHAIMGASHWQFVSYKKVLQQFLPIDMDKPMGQVRRLDEMINNAGYLRLMPTDPHVMNMSNTLANVPGQTSQINTSSQPVGIKRRLLEFLPVKHLFLSLYNQIFRWYLAR